MPVSVSPHILRVRKHWTAIQGLLFACFGALWFQVALLNYPQARWQAAYAVAALALLALSIFNVVRNFLRPWPEEVDPNKNLRLRIVALNITLAVVCLLAGAALAAQDARAFAFPAIGLLCAAGCAVAAWLLGKPQIYIAAAALLALSIYSMLPAAGDSAFLHMVAGAGSLLWIASLLCLARPTVLRP